MRLAHRLASAALLVVLAAGCGDTTFPWSSETSSAGGGGTASFSVSPQALRFDAVEGGSAPAAQTFTLSFQGTGPFYFSLAPSGVVTSTAPIPGTGEIRVTVGAPGAAGTTTGAVTVHAFRNPDASGELSDSPKTVAVTYVVSPAPPPQPAVSVAPGTSLSFTAPAGRPAPAAQSFQVGIANGPVRVEATASGEAIASVAVVAQTASAATVEVTPAAPATLAGARFGTVTLRGCLDASCSQVAAGSGAQVPVTFLTSDSLLQASPASFGGFTGLPVIAGVPLTRTITISDPNGTAPWTVGRAPDSEGATWLSAAPASGADLPAEVTLTIDVPATASPGVVGAALEVTSLGVARRVPVTVNVARPGIVASTPPPLAAVRTQAALPAASIDLATQHGGALDFSTSVTYGAGASGWLSVAAGGSAPGPLGISAATTTLPPGTYAATLRLAPANGAVPTDVAVTYTVTAPALSASPSPVSFTVGTATTEAETAAAVAVAGEAGTAIAWTAEASAPWVSVSPASGTAPGGATVSLVRGPLKALPPGAHAATVTFRYEGAPGLPASMTLPVSLLLDLPRLEAATPRIVVAGSTADVIVRGTGLASPFTGTVLFGGRAATAVTRLSSTELRVTPPALDLGSPPVLQGAQRPVTVDNALGLARSTAMVEVVDVEVRAADSVALAGRKRRVLFDDYQRALYVVNAGTGTLHRLRENTGWVPEATDALAIPFLTDAVLSPDRTTLVVAAGSELGAVDAASFAVTTAPNATSAYTVNLAMLASGQVVWAYEASTFASVGIYDPATRTRAQLPYPDSSFYAARVVAPADGSEAFLFSTGLAERVLTFDADGTARRSDPGTSWHRLGAADRHAERRLLFGTYDGTRWTSRLYDAAWVLRGTGTIPPQYAGSPPPGALPATLAAVLSPLGNSRVYTWDGTAVRILDTAGTPDATTGVYPLLDSVTPTRAPGANVVMTVSADERTAFLAGDDRVVVVPLPAP